MDSPYILLSTSPHPVQMSFFGELLHCWLFSTPMLGQLLRSQHCPDSAQKAIAFSRGTIDQDVSSDVPLFHSVPRPPDPLSRCLGRA
jgi:hypothetical protein